MHACMYTVQTPEVYTISRMPDTNTIQIMWKEDATAGKKTAGKLVAGDVMLIHKQMTAEWNIPSVGEYQ